MWYTSYTQPFVIYFMLHVIFVCLFCSVCFFVGPSNTKFSELVIWIFILLVIVCIIVYILYIHWYVKMQVCFYFSKRTKENMRKTSIVLYCICIYGPILHSWWLLLLLYPICWWKSAFIVSTTFILTFFEKRYYIFSFEFESDECLVCLYGSI